MGTFAEILQGIPWYGWVAIVAILAGATRSIIAQTHSHEQRMEMIKRGLDPSEDPKDVE